MINLNQLETASHRNVSTLKTRKRKESGKKSDWYNHLMKKLDCQIKDLKKLIKK